MDRPVTQTLPILKEPEWLLIRKRILSHTAIEKAIDSKREALIEALLSMGELELITQASFKNGVEPCSSATTEAAASAPSLLATPSTSALPKNTQRAAKTGGAEANYRTSRQEYASALGNQGLIEALLRYHRRRGPGNKSIILSGLDSETETTFTAEQIPQIQVEEKARSFRHPSGVAVPVLRTKKEP